MITFRNDLFGVVMMSKSSSQVSEYRGSKPDIHECLVSSENTISSGELSKTAEFLPDLRQWLENRPPTSVTWTVNQSPIDIGFRLKPKAVEMLGTWQVSGQRSPGSYVRWVTPGSKDAHLYSDAVVQCRCGATQVLHTESSHPAETPHADGCKPQWKCNMRAELFELRETMIYRLSRLNWTRDEVGVRLGYPDGEALSVSKNYNVEYGTLRDEFRRLAANTYKHLVNQGVKAGTIADVYGHHKSTLRRWCREYGDLEP